MTAAPSFKGRVPPPLFIPVDVMRRQRVAELECVCARLWHQVRLSVPGVGERWFPCDELWRGDVRDRRRLARSSRPWPKRFRFPDAEGVEWRFGRADFQKFSDSWLAEIDRRARLKWNALARLDGAPDAEAAWLLPLPVIEGA